MINRSFAPFPILATERLILRQLIIDDEQEIFSLRSDSEINKYLDRQVSNTIDDARNFIKRLMRTSIKMTLYIGQ
jgi:ribosomal-protein-alanine N-acetyltransferase